VLRAVAAVICALLLAGCSDGPSGYDGKVERDFIGGCRSGGASTPVCQCVFDRIVDDMPFATFKALDERREDEPGYLSPELRRFAVDCATEDVLGGQ
jgi:hypothetical protein